MNCIGYVLGLFPTYVDNLFSKYNPTFSFMMWELLWDQLEAHWDYFWASHVCKLESGSFIVWEIKAKKNSLHQIELQDH